ncbi:MAG: peptide deformylase [Clostridia bacterium]|nr:peptide deformylase [Clostridia bacterium]
MATRRILNERTDAQTLRRKSRAVETVDQRILTLLDDMAETMAAADGVGLAAPQVGVLRRVAVVDVCDGSGLFELINPEIIEQSGEQEGIEGCLSITNMQGMVKRPLDIKVKTLDRNGQEKILSAHGYLARAMCHEIDHLDGVLFIDKATDLTRPEEYSKR